MKTAEDLRGRLERVHIKNIYPSSIEGGVFDNQPVLIRNAANYVGKECLVRFEDRIDPSHRLPISRFISKDTSQAPNPFEGYAPDEYILYGLIDCSVRGSRKVLNYRDLIERFDPGSVNYFVFKSSISCKEKYTISKKRIHPQKRLTFGQLIRKSMPNPNKSARVIIIEGSEDEKTLLEAINSSGLEAIKMDPLI